MLHMFKSSDRYGDRLNTFDAVKLLALATMVVDHVGDYLMPETRILRAIGRMAFPLFLFMVGYSGAWTLRRDLFIWAALVLGCAALTHHAVLPLNILFSIAAVRWAMALLVKKDPTPRRLAAIFFGCIACFPLFYWFDYSTLAVLFAMCGYLQRRFPGSEMTSAFIGASGALYLLIESAIFSKFYQSEWMCMLGVLVLAVWIMRNFRLEPMDGGGLPAIIRRALQWAARNTLPLYGLHVIVLMVFERLCFPERLLQFQWTNF